MAARRAGMSLTDWLNSSIGGVGEPAHDQRPNPPLSPQNAPEVAEIHQRLDSIARQIETISRPTDRDQPPVARQLNDAISRLDERLSRITTPKPQAEPQPQPPFVPLSRASMAERPAASTGRPSPSPLDSAIAEILARQNELEAGRAASQPPLSTATVAPERAMPGQMSALEQQLAKITSRIEALHQPAQVDHAIASFRGELADIRRVITEAMPRQAIESIERDIRLLAQRIDDSRHNGSDNQTLAGVE
ncbi:MAG: hypothetical protein J0H32_18900, partial [Rhizobiales bacterium]|nr:hypothetical protein [Hyphomicrobiales bacterium]